MSNKVNEVEKQEVAEVATKKETTTKASAKASGVKVYVGPSLRGVAKGSIMKNGVLPVLEKAVAKAPFFAELIVPIENLVEARKQLANKKSAMSKYYSAAEKYNQEDK